MKCEISRYNDLIVHFYPPARCRWQPYASTTLPSRVEFVKYTEFYSINIYRYQLPLCKPIIWACFHFRKLEFAKLGLLENGIYTWTLLLKGIDPDSTPALADFRKAWEGRNQPMTLGQRWHRNQAAFLCMYNKTTMGPWWPPMLQDVARWCQHNVVLSIGLIMVHIIAVGPTMALSCPNIIGRVWPLPSSDDDKKVGELSGR